VRTSSILRFACARRAAWLAPGRRGPLKSFHPGFAGARPLDFIQLPPLGEAGTLTLVEELENAAAGVGRARGSRSPSVATALQRLLEATERLQETIVARERSGSTADPKARAADRVLDDAWGAFQSWLLGWTRLPDAAHPRIEEVRRLYAGTFPKGLQFLTLDFKDEWTESKNRLDQFAVRGLDRLIHELGGEPFLATIDRAHRAYGDALHITGSAPEPDVFVRRALDEAHMALREYVAQVAATVRRDEPASVDEAARLLAPLSARSFDDDVTIASGPPVSVPSGGGQRT
jgi:hypothetical protein